MIESREYISSSEKKRSRIVQKPHMVNKAEDFGYEEDLQEQMDRLRTRIKLRERANKVHAEKDENCHKVAALSQLIRETTDLRWELAKALKLEKLAVHNALRSHREFQLATRKLTNEEAKEWIGDKMFDMCKRLNRLLYILNCKRKHLQDLEREAPAFEELVAAAMNEFSAFGGKQSSLLAAETSNMKVKLEAANILHRKYKQIKDLLQQEQLMYHPTIRNLEVQYLAKKKELADFVKMFNEAKGFHESALKSLRATTAEIQDRRRKRKRQLTKLKNATKALLLSYSRKYTAMGIPSAKFNHHFVTRNSSFAGEYHYHHGGRAHNYDRKLYLMNAMAELDFYHDKSVRLLEVMRLKDIREVPRRLYQVSQMAKTLAQQLSVKESLRDTLIKQRDQLGLVFNFLKYSGHHEAEEEQSEIQRQLAENQRLEDEIGKLQEKCQKYAETHVEIRVSLLPIAMKLLPGFGKRKQSHVYTKIPYLLKILHVKINHLVKEVQELEKELLDAGFPPMENDEETFRFYLPRGEVPLRLIRTESEYTMKAAEESLSSEDLDDHKVPTRLDIKIQNKKVENIGLLRQMLDGHKFKRPLIRSVNN